LPTELKRPVNSVINSERNEPHTTGERIPPACATPVRTMFGTEAEDEITKIPLSDDTMCRRINCVPDNIKEIVSDKIKKSMPIFTLTDFFFLGGGVGGSSTVSIYSIYLTYSG
jgi:hypothetical protein